MKRYICEKENNDRISCYLDFNQIDGFKVRPRNRVKYEGIEVSVLTVTNPHLINNVLKRKTKRKLNAYLEFLIESVEDDDTTSGDLALILADAAKYKAIIINKYSKFLDMNYVKELLLRVNFIEEELKLRIHEYNNGFNVSFGKGR